MATILRIIDRFWPVLTVVALLAVATLSLIPLEAPLPKAVSSDKLHHFVAYGIVALPVALARPRLWFLYVLGFAVWAAAIELVQPLVNRHCSAADMAANIGGLFLAIAGSGVIRHFAPAHGLTTAVAHRTNPVPRSSAHGRR